MKIVDMIDGLEVLVDSDVLVGGGGPAGLGASIAAARGGAKVVLLEQTGALGGMATVGLVPCIANLYSGDHNIAAGVCMEIVTEVCRRMGLAGVAKCWQPVDAEIFKQVCDDMVAEAGIKVLFNQKIAAVESSKGKLHSVIAAGSNGLKRISGKVFVDCTGDAAISAFAGVEFEAGDANGVTMSPSLCVQYAGVDWNEYSEAGRQGRNCRTIWRELLDAGTAPLPEYHLVGAYKVANGVATGNLGHVYGLNAIDEDDLSQGYVEGRKVARILHQFFKEHVPGFQNSELVNTASLLSVRETRRINGEYRLSFEDYVKRAVFKDDICRYSYPVDIHSSSTDAEEQKRVGKRMKETRYQPGESYGIPYRALIPVGVDNLLVAGRSISCDRELQSSLRVMPACFLTGQAAGMAAALSLKADGEVRAVDAVELRDLLKQKIGAYLP